MEKTYSCCSPIINVEHFAGPRSEPERVENNLDFFSIINDPLLITYTLNGTWMNVSILQFPICIVLFTFAIIFVMEHLDHLHQIREHYKFEFDRDIFPYFIHSFLNFSYFFTFYSLHFRYFFRWRHHVCCTCEISCRFVHRVCELILVFQTKTEFQMDIFVNPIRGENIQMYKMFGRSVCTRFIHVSVKVRVRYSWLMLIVCHSIQMGLVSCIWRWVYVWVCDKP